MFLRGIIQATALAAVLSATTIAVCAEGPSAATQPAGQGWSHWAGPNYNCTSDETGLLKEWPKDGPKVLWRVPVGVGSNHPSVAGSDVVFTQADPGFATESTICLDLDTGKQKWKNSYSVVYPAGNQTPENTNFVGWGKVGPRATPALSADYAFSLGTIGNALCVERKTGKVLWSKDLKDGNPCFLDDKGELKKFNQIGEWKGFNHSPAVAGGKALFAPHVQPLILALDEKTGKELWRYAEDPIKGSHPWGIMQMLVMTFNKEECCLIQYNYGWRMVRVSDGKLVWQYRGQTPTDRYSNGTIVPLAPRYFLASTDGISPGVYECDFTQTDPQPKQLWSDVEVNDNQVPPVCVNGYIYGFGYEKRSDQWGLGDNPHQSLSLQCTDMKTGKMMWKSKPDFTYGISISAADGMLYVHSFQKLTLVEANPKAYVEKVRVEKLHNVEYARGHEQALVDWNMPVIVNKKLIVRTPVEIICYDIADTKPSP